MKITTLILIIVALVFIAIISPVAFCCYVVYSFFSFAKWVIIHFKKEKLSRIEKDEIRFEDKADFSALSGLYHIFQKETPLEKHLREKAQNKKIDSFIFNG